MSLGRIASGIAGGLGGLATSVGAEALESIVRDPITGAVDLAKIEAFQGIIKTWLAEFLQSFIAKADPQSVIDPEGIVDIFLESMRATAKLGMILGKETVEELVMELIQEGLSNAIQFSISGALQNILSWYRGAIALQPTEPAKVFRDLNNIDSNMAKYLVGVSGEAVATLTYRMLEGYQEFLDKEYGAVKEQAVAHVRLLNDIALWYNNVYRSELERMMARSIRLLEELYDRYLSLAYNVIDRAVGRLNEVYAEAETSYTLYQSQIISPDEAYDDLLEIDLYLDATKSAFDDAYNTIYNQLQSDIASYVFPNVKSLIDARMSELYQQIANFVGAITVQYDFQKAVDIIETIQKIRQAELSSVSKSSEEVSAPSGGLAGIDVGSIEIELVNIIPRASR